MTVLPETLGQLTNLQKLNLDYNQLTELPNSIGQLNNLQILKLDDNKLIKLPDTLYQLTNLHTLNLQGNSNLGINSKSFYTHELIEKLFQRQILRKISLKRNNV